MATTLLGTGVFILPQMTIAIAQQQALLAWALLTAMMLPVALVFGRLSGVLPHAAGPAYFVEKAFGLNAGRSIGLIFLLVVPIGAPAALLMTFEFVTSVIPLSGIGLLVGQGLALLSLWLLNRKGLQISAKLQFALTLAIVAVVVTMLLALSATPLPQVTSHDIEWRNLSPMLQAAGVAFWSFLGIEAMTHLSKEFKDPKRDMLPAMSLGVLLVGVLYLCCCYLLIDIKPGDGLAMVVAFDRLFGGYGALVIGVLGSASGLATVNVYAASTSRLMASFAEQGILPTVLARKNRYGVPMLALTLLLSVNGLVLLFAYLSNQSLHDLISWSNGVFVLIYGASMLAATRLLGRRFRRLAWLGLLPCFALAWGLGWQMLYALAVLAIAVLFLSRKRLINTG
ncbi:L-methionine/branched-chain amino acid transporter [Paraferrimonas haliotis]|uniref:L-methionine/branched-chain amino acid transporter n=2 Tax=Paraferrimonas haliotis TaxID=2013866 RepID=A0AA37WVJ5_9GAMM|nr:L-methionine/branched-chain amino acid transporter [Paraferrimonas haliotis]